MASSLIKTQVEVMGEEVNLTYNKFFGWKVVHPIKDKDGKYIWINLLFGGKGNLIALIILGIIILSATITYYQWSAELRDMSAHPCKYFSNDMINKCQMEMKSQGIFDSLNSSLPVIPLPKR